ncbi:sigma-54 interaction domain-containing protein [Rhodocaloribacter sp.]
MSRILISWTATTHDFIKKGGDITVDSEGPNVQVHRHYWEYDRHLLLCSVWEEARVDEDPFEKEVRAKAHCLSEYLRRTFPGHQVNVRFLGIRDVISFSEVRSKVEKLLESFSSQELDIFVSPGTGVMQTAWYFTHFGMGLRTRLFHLRPAQFTESGIPERVFEDIEQSTVPQSLVIRERLEEERQAVLPPVRQRKEEKFLLTQSIESVYDQAQRVADTDHVTVLILGESGVGKEHLARFIHEKSARHSRPFLAVNCSALGDELLESRLFGYKKGAFTGAFEDRAGIFEEADGGTVFLDEVGDSSPVMQQALLRVLQERVVTRIGETEARKVDVRVIAATHQDLADQCEQGKFRWDLFYRLAVAELELPPLRERGTSELKDLINHFLRRKQQDFRRPRLLNLTAQVRAILLKYPYPGNVRELEHLIERLYVFCNDEAEIHHLPTRVLKPQGRHSLLLEDVERRHVERVFHQFEGNKSKTANALGCAVNTLKNKLEKYQIEFKGEKPRYDGSSL